MFVKNSGLKANAEKIKNMFMFLYQTIGHNYYIKVDNKSFGNMAEFKFTKIIAFARKLKAD